MALTYTGVGGDGQSGQIDAALCGAYLAAMFTRKTRQQTQQTLPIAARVFVCGWIRA